jgi:hypothetical protein
MGGWPEMAKSLAMAVQWFQILPNLDHEHVQVQKVYHT